MTKTENYQLNQWDPEDRVTHTDFNADNAKIDAALASKADADALGSIMVTGDAGPRESTKLIDLGFRPRLAFLLADGEFVEILTRDRNFLFRIGKSSIYPDICNDRLTDSGIYIAGTYEVGENDPANIHYIAFR